MGKTDNLKLFRPDSLTLVRIINDALRNLYEEGFTTDTDLTCHEHLGFHPGDVDGLHTHKIGEGDGVWFRLKDGRVFNSFGEAEDTDPSLYDTVKN